MTKPKIKEVITKFEDTGDCEIDCNVTVKLWSRLWMLSQWNDEFRLIKFVRKDSPNTALKVTISSNQAQELIQRLSLKGLQHPVFSSGTSWRLDQPAQ